MHGTASRRIEIMLNLNKKDAKKRQYHRKIIWILTSLTLTMFGINPALCSTEAGFIGLPHNSEQTAQSRPRDHTAASSCAKIRVILAAAYLQLLAEAHGGFLQQ